MRHISQLLIVALLAATGCHQKAASTSAFAAERQRMVQEQLMPRGVHDERVLAAMSKVPREEFVPDNLRDKSYSDNALPIGHDQTISQPFIVASMTQQLKEGGRMVIPVGTGLDQQLFLLEKKEGQMAERAILPVRFVQMTGEAATKK